MRVLIFTLMLAGCATQQSYLTPPTLEYVTVRMVWLETVDGVRESCRNQSAGACATVGKHNGGLVTIWAMKPTSFSDESRMCKLGHELLHNLGATHE